MKYGAIFLRGSIRLGMNQATTSNNRVNPAIETVFFKVGMSNTFTTIVGPGTLMTKGMPSRLAILMAAIEKKSATTTSGLFSSNRCSNCSSQMC